MPNARFCVVVFCLASGGGELFVLLHRRREPVHQRVYREAIVTYTHKTKLTAVELCRGLWIALY